MTNFLIKPYDAIEEVIRMFADHNSTPPDEREYTESQLTQLAVNRIKAAQAAD